MTQHQEENKKAALKESLKLKEKAKGEIKVQRNLEK